MTQLWRDCAARRLRTAKKWGNPSLPLILRKIIRTRNALKNISFRKAWAKENEISPMPLHARALLPTDSTQKQARVFSITFPHSNEPEATQAVLAPERSSYVGCVAEMALYAIVGLFAYSNPQHKGKQRYRRLNSKNVTQGYDRPPCPSLLPQLFP